MDYNKKIRELIEDFDLTSEIQRKQAYNKCFEYAESYFEDNKEFNAFFRVVSNILNIPTIIKDTVSNKIDETGDEKLHLSYSKESGPILAGNFDGLIYFSKLLHELAETRESANHVHFYQDEFPMCGDSFPLTIYYENDEWFEKYSVKQNDPEKIPEREVDPNGVKAVIINDESPPEFYFTQCKLYKVTAVEKYDHQQVMIKSIREENDRVFVFSFMNDLNQPVEVGLDLDDAEVLFLTAEDLDQIHS